MARLTQDQMAKVIVGLIKKSADASKLARQIADYLVKTRQTRQLDGLMRKVERLRREQNGVVEVTMTTASPLEPAVKQQLNRLFPAQKLIVNEVRQSQIIGGIQLETSDEQLDYSVKHRLRTALSRKRKRAYE